jgi:hypothetical protein
MFDVRYHVASLAAVFVALIIGILVGVGISSHGVLGNPERSLLNEKIAELQGKLDGANGQIADLANGGRAGAAFVDSAYQAVMRGRLKGKRVAVVFVGPVDGALRTAVQQTLADAGGRLVRLRALQVPVRIRAVSAALEAGPPAVSALAGAAHIRDVGRALGRELVAGGDSAVWDALSGLLVEEQAGVRRPPADAVVVIRTAAPQYGATAQFLSGLYAGLDDGGKPAVGAEDVRAAHSAVTTYRRFGLSTVDDVDLAVGRVALAELLAGGRQGHYGLKQTADGGVLPPVPPVVTAPGAGG